jgi:lysozyme
MSIVPPERPGLTRTAAKYYLHAAGIPDEFALIGRRAYYRDTMGKPGENDRGIYDDAIALITPTAFVTFNANCDPSAWRQGIATLMPGVWQYRVGTHGITKPPERRYEALVQAGPVMVTRDGGKTETGWFGINIHRGGFNTTSSEGCQTIHPTQWEGFIGLVKGEMARHSRIKIDYVLTERESA